VFIAAKEYQDCPIAGHVVPNSDLAEVYTLTETDIRNNVENIPHKSKVRCRLVTLMLTKLQGKLECDCCKTLQFVVY